MANNVKSASFFSFTQNYQTIKRANDRDLYVGVGPRKQEIKRKMGSHLAKKKVVFHQDWFTFRWLKWSNYNRQIGILVTCFYPLIWKTWRSGKKIHADRKYYFQNKLTFWTALKLGETLGEGYQAERSLCWEIQMDKPKMLFFFYWFVRCDWPTLVLIVTDEIDSKSVWEDWMKSCVSVCSIVLNVTNRNDR